MEGSAQAPLDLASSETLDPVSPVLAVEPEDEGTVFLHDEDELVNSSKSECEAFGFNVSRENDVLTFASATVEAKWRVVLSRGVG